jgi:hypothetical protein
LRLIDISVVLRLGIVVSALVVLLFLWVAITSNRWLLGALALYFGLSAVFHFGWHSLLLTSTVSWLADGRALQLRQDLGAIDYVALPLERLIWALLAFAVAVCGIMSAYHLIRRPRRELDLIRTAGGGKGISFRRILAVFDIPISFARRAPGRSIRLALSLLGVGFAAYGISMLIDAPGTMTSLDIVNLQRCVEDYPTKQLPCVAFSYVQGEGDITTMGLERLAMGYIGFPVLGMLAAALIINLAKRFTPAPLLEDATAPILFLRSFADDQARIKPRSGGLLTAILDFGRAPDSIDQLLTYEFAARAPVVALGKPGERRPPFGARRIYADHAGWKGEIEALFSSSQAIVLVIDRSQGIEWEIEQCLARPELREKTLFLMRAPEDYEVLAPVLGDASSTPPNRAVLAAHCSADGWNVLTARRKTRITYQICARRFFQDRTAAMNASGAYSAVSAS